MQCTIGLHACVSLRRYEPNQVLWVFLNRSLKSDTPNAKFHSLYEVIAPNVLNGP